MTATLDRPVSLLADPDALVPPAFWSCPDYVETLGPEVAEFGGLCGRTPSPEQRLLLDGSFGLDRRGRLAAFEVVVVGSRQNFKTGFLEFKALGKAVLLKRPLQIWTAHKESATEEALRDFLTMIDSSAELSRRVRRVTQGKGDKSIEFRDDARIVFRPRTGKAGQSMSADDIDLDETFAVESKHVGSLMPTLSTRPHAQVTFCSSAPHPTSGYLRSLMARGRAGNDPRMLYAEWSVQRLVGTHLDGAPKYGPPPCELEGCGHAPGTPGCVADDRELIKLANPAVGRSAPPAISWDFIASERQSLSGALEEYFRERLGAGDEGVGAAAMTIFGPPEVWQAGQVSAPPDQVGAVGVAMTADRGWIGITGASLVEHVPEDDPEAEPVDRVLVAPILHTRDPGEAITELKRLQDAHDCAVGLDGGGPAGTLIDDLETADVAVETFDLTRYAKASGKFHDRVTAAPTQLLHLANAPLDDTVASAAWRWVRDNRVIARRDGQETLDITLLEAGVIATELAENVGAFNIY